MAKAAEIQAEQPDQASLKQVLLDHLLSIEGEAAILVDDAQAEVDHRIGEAERENRARYEERYNQEMEALEAAYHREIDGVKAYYEEELDAYRGSLDQIDRDRDRFSALLSALLAGNI
jgi:hypothetical protein